MTVAADLSNLTPAERKAVANLLEVGQIMHDLYLQQRHPEALAAAQQIDALAEAKPAVIVAQTMPAVTEALGMADKLAKTGTPYIISFVINRFGRVLDNTPVAQAVEQIDQSVSSPPVGYMVNCVHHAVFDEAGVSRKG